LLQENVQLLEPGIAKLVEKYPPKPIETKLKLTEVAESNDEHPCPFRHRFEWKMR